MSDVPHPSVVRGSVDLTSCDLEPVHLIATVQSHGALLSFDPKSGRLLEASDNWRQFLPQVEKTDLNSLFSPKVAMALQAVESDRAIVLPQTIYHWVFFSCIVSLYRLLLLLVVVV